MIIRDKETFSYELYEAKVKVIKANLIFELLAKEKERIASAETAETTGEYKEAFDELYEDAQWELENAISNYAYIDEVEEVKDSKERELWELNRRLKYVKI